MIIILDNKCKLPIKTTLHITFQKQQKTSWKEFKD